MHLRSERVPQLTLASIDRVDRMQLTAARVEYISTEGFLFPVRIPAGSLSRPVSIALQASLALPVDRVASTAEARGAALSLQPSGVMSPARIVSSATARDVSMGSGSVFAVFRAESVSEARAVSVTIQPDAVFSPDRVASAAEARAPTLANATSSIMEIIAASSSVQVRNPAFSRDADATFSPARIIGATTVRNPILEAEEAPASVLDTLTAAYKFEAGSFLLDALGGTSLANVNSVTSSSGKFGNAATFNGNLQGINTALTRTFSYTAGSFSVSLWAMRNNTGVNFALLDLDAQNRIFQRASGEFVFRASNTDLTVAGNTYWPASTWTHFAFVFSGSSHLLYINGVHRGTASGGGGGGAATAYLGNLSSGQWVLNGQIDELYFANGTAWDAAQVAELYNSGAGLFL